MGAGEERDGAPSSVRLTGGRAFTTGTLTRTSPPPPGGAPRLSTFRCSPSAFSSRPARRLMRGT